MSFPAAGSTDPAQSATRRHSARSVIGNTNEWEQREAFRLLEEHKKKEERKQKKRKTDETTEDETDPQKDTETETERETQITDNNNNNRKQKLKSEVSSSASNPPMKAEDGSTESEGDHGQYDTETTNQTQEQQQQADTVSNTATNTEDKEDNKSTSSSPTKKPYSGAKRGRPSLAEIEKRKKEAAERGEVYAPKKRNPPVPGAKRGRPRKHPAPVTTPSSNESAQMVSQGSAMMRQIINGLTEYSAVTALMLNVASYARERIAQLEEQEKQQQERKEQTEQTDNKQQNQPSSSSSSSHDSNHTPQAQTNTGQLGSQ